MITKDKLKGFLSGILVALGTWMIVVTLQDDILAIVPIKNKYLIGIVLIVASWYVGKK